MLLLVDGHDHYSTEQIQEMWDFVDFDVAEMSHDVIIDPLQGRVSSGGAFYDAELGSLLRKSFVWGGTGRKATLGIALRTETLRGDGMTLLQLRTTADHVYVLRLNAFRQLQVIHILPDLTFDIWGATVPRTINNDFGYYVEMQVTLVQGVVAGGDTFPLLLKVNGVELLNPLVPAPVAPDAGPFTVVSIGGLCPAGPSLVEKGTWWSDDIYLLDGVAAASPVLHGGINHFNNDFLGDTHVRTILPTADGLDLASLGLFQWLPTPFGTHYTTVNDLNVDTVTDLKYDSAGTNDSQESFQFNDLTLFPSEFNWPIFGIMLCPRIRLEGGTDASMQLTVRRYVDGLLANDIVDQTATRHVTWSDYKYLPMPLDRDPTVADTAFYTYLLMPHPDPLPTPNDMELGLFMDNLV